MFNQLRGTTGSAARRRGGASYAAFGGADAARPRRTSIPRSTTGSRRTSSPAGVRGPRREVRGTRRPDLGRDRRRRGAAGARRGRRAAGVRQHLPPPRPRAAALRRLRPASGQHRLPLPRAGTTSSTAVLRNAPGGFRDLEGFDKCEFGLLAIAVVEWHGWVFIDPSASSGPFEEHVGGMEQIVANYRPEDLVTVALALLRARDELEGHRRELPGVLPLPLDPPRAVPDQPAAERREPRLRRRLDRWLDGPDPRGRHDVARRPQRRHGDRGAERRRAADGDVRRRRSPTC